MQVWRFQRNQCCIALHLHDLSSFLGVPAQVCNLHRSYLIARKSSFTTNSLKQFDCFTRFICLQLQRQSEKYTQWFPTGRLERPRRIQWQSRVVVWWGICRRWQRSRLLAIWLAISWARHLVTCRLIITNPVFIEICINSKAFNQERTWAQLPAQLQPLCFTASSSNTVCWSVNPGLVFKFPPKQKDYFCSLTTLRNSATEWIHRLYSLMVRERSDYMTLHAKAVKLKLLTFHTKSCFLGLAWKNDLLFLHSLTYLQVSILTLHIGRCEHKYHPQ